MTASKHAGWFSKWISDSLSRASLRSQEAYSLASSWKFPSVDGLCSCRRSSRSWRGQRRTVTWLKRGPGTGESSSRKRTRADGSMALTRVGKRGDWRWVMWGGADFVPEPYTGTLSSGYHLSRGVHVMWAPGQARLLGCAGAACCPGCRELMGAGQREAPCDLSLMSWAHLQQLRSLAMQRTRAAPSSSCLSYLLPKTAKNPA